MVKGILLAFILAACIAAGRMLSNARKRRMRTIGDILAAMRVLRLRMLNSMEPVGILLRKSELGLFKNIGDSLWEGSGLHESWEQRKIQETKRGRMLDCLTDEDLKTLDLFFDQLGGSGREEQNNLFSVTITALEEAQSQAKSDFSDRARLYTALGALTGVGICILIM